MCCLEDNASWNCQTNTVARSVCSTYAIKLAKKLYVCNNLEANKGNLHKTWNVINELTSRNSGKSTNTLEIKVDNEILSNPMDIAETINDHFTNVAQVLAQDIPVVDVNPESYLKPTDHSFSLQIPSVDIVSNVLSKIDEKKATGLDMIPSKLLKMAASIVAPSLTSIFSESILTGIYPNDRKTAKVTPLFKKGIKSDPNNYRPISVYVIPIISKVFERIVYHQLFHYLDDNKLLLGCQSGFRSLHSTLTALLEAANAWSLNIVNGLNGLVFIDLTKAFNTIDHEIILRKMSYLGVNQAAIKWISSYLRRCNVSGKLSSARTFSCGVPQGSILGPFLFLIFPTPGGAPYQECLPMTPIVRYLRVDHTKSLGLASRCSALSWGKHAEEICKKVSSAISAQKHVQPFISKETAIQIYNALIMTH